VTPERLAEIKERLAAETRHLADFAADGMADGATCWSQEYVEDVGTLVTEVERARRLLLWLSAAYLDALYSLRGEGCEPTQWGTHRNMERLATTIAESAPKGTPFTPEQMQALEAWAAEVTL
jgi:hypothetical protein